MSDETTLRRLLSHPWINKTGIAVALYPETSREQARKNLAWRDELRADEIERLKADAEALNSIISEILK